MTPTSGEVTSWLAAWQAGDRGAYDRVVTSLYAELRRLARRSLSGEAPGHTLEPTALVHEAYLRLAGQNRVDWQGRAHFFGVAATVMRRILLQHARAKRASKRGLGAVHVPLEEASPWATVDPEQILAVDQALSDLARLDPRQARIVELRLFAGLSVDEVASVLALSTATVKRDWRLSTAFLKRELAPRPGGPSP